MTPESSTWWKGLTAAEFAAQHPQELPRIQADPQGFKLVPLSTYHDLAMWPRRSGFAGSGQPLGAR